MDSFQSDNKLLDELVNFINTHIHEFEKLKVQIKNTKKPEDLKEYKQQILYVSYISDKLNYGLSLLDYIKYENSNLYDNKIIQMCNTSISPMTVETKKIQPIIPSSQKKISLYKDIREYGMININVVSKKLEIPNINLYFITENKEFGIRINNNLITGNLVNILSKKDQYNINKCTIVNCANPTCKYYHSYDENKNFNDQKYYEFNILDYKYRDLFFGSKDKIKEEAPKLTQEYKEYRMRKLMHELLMFQIISNFI